MTTREKLGLIMVAITYLAGMIEWAGWLRTGMLNSPFLEMAQRGTPEQWLLLVWLVLMLFCIHKED